MRITHFNPQVCMGNMKDVVLHEMGLVSGRSRLEYLAKQMGRHSGGNSKF